jgi:hypothetical protein
VNAGAPGQARPAASITLAPGTEDAGLAAMLADLLRQNLEQNPGRRRDFDRLQATIGIEALDAEVAITLEFRRGSLVVHAGTLEKAGIRIAADSATVLELSSLRIRCGLPGLLDAGGRRLLAKVLAGQVRIAGALTHLPSLLRVTRLMSVIT